jgi:hypothetical protein
MGRVLRGMYRDDVAAILGRAGMSVQDAPVSSEALGLPGSIRARKLVDLEAAPIGGQLFAHGISGRDCIAFCLLLDTYDTRLLAQALRQSLLGILDRKFCQFFPIC